MSIYEGHICRCCAADRPSKDLITAYNWMGEEEVYADMLRECFDINLDTGDEDGICELCITQLRNAFNFKKQVLQTEEQFKNKRFRITTNNDEIQIKEVKVKVEPLKDDFDGDDDADMDDAFGDQDSSSDYEVPIKEDPEQPPPKAPKRRGATLAALKKKAKPAAGPSKSAEPTRRRSQRTKRNTVATPERLQHRVNLTTILRNSNATPFRDKRLKGYSCLYCGTCFANFDELRAHAALPSEQEKLNKMIDYKLACQPIKVDITDLKCKLCNAPMTDLNELKHHLSDVHSKKIHKDIKDSILPFRLQDGDNFTCVICTLVHISFKNLYQHMSVHYRNYCCDVCGVGYITLGSLRKHSKTHLSGHFPCQFCDKIFSSLMKRNAHMKGVHRENGWYRNKCPLCPEIFVSYYLRNEHMALVHDEKLITHPCQACDKIFKKKYELNRHIKNFHLKQKSYMCDMCNATYFTRRGLVEHMDGHNMDGEEHTCDVCGKKFAKRRVYKEHMKSHSVTAKPKCDTCGKTFSQVYSLKSHVKLHQNLEIFKEFDDVNHLVDDRDLTLKEIARESKRKEREEAMKQDNVMVPAPIMELPDDKSIVPMSIPDAFSIANEVSNEDY